MASKIDARVGHRTNDFWLTLAAAVAGPSHFNAGRLCDDWFSAKLAGAWLAAVVCDGAGSAAKGREGARFFAEGIVDRLTAEVPNRDPCMNLRTLVGAIVADLRSELGQSLNDDSDSLSDYHTTVVGVIARRGRGLFFHIGDGAAVAFRNGPADDPSPPEEADERNNPDPPPGAGEDARPVDERSFDDGQAGAACAGRRSWTEVAISQPFNGEYANETVFVTMDDWREHLRFRGFVGAECLTLMTDGVTSFALQRFEDETDPEFIEPLLNYFDGCHDRSAAIALAKTLDRDDARKASGDDKTFLWAAPVADQPIAEGGEAGDGREDH